MSEVIIEAKDLEKSFGKTKVVNHISFTINRGDVFGFIGPNGAGKTTTIRMMLGLLKIDSGDVCINNYSIKDDFYKAISKVGALVEGPAFYEYMSARENLECFGAYSGGVSKQRIESLLKLVGLQDRAKDKVKAYSLGMKQRLGIAQALLNDPQILVLDEPTNGLDPQGIKDIREIIRSLSSQGVTIFVSSHILSEIENVCNKILLIKDGTKVICSETRDLINKQGMYDIVATNTEDLLQVLGDIKDVSIIVAKDTIRVKLENNILPEELLRQLIYMNVKVKVYHPVNMSLEDYFFNATGGDR